MPVVVTVPESNCLEGQPGPWIPTEELRALAMTIRSRCLSPDGKPLADDLPCLLVGETMVLAEITGGLIKYAMTAETLCRAPAVGMGGVR